MPHYRKLGKIPRKRHIQFRKANGDLYSEQLVSTEGFSDTYSLVYHHYPPTRVLKIDKSFSVAPEIAINKNMQNRSFQGFKAKPESDFRFPIDSGRVVNWLLATFKAPSDVRSPIASGRAVNWLPPKSK